MNFELPVVNRRLSKGLIYLQDHSTSCSIMDVRTRKVSAPPLVEGKKVEYHQNHHQGKKIEFQRTLSHGKGSGRRLLPANYFSLESLLLLVCLTVSLLILPLILPPLPPPPFMLLLLPIGILAVLMVLAFMPSNVRDITYTYV
nr:protein auxin-regulated gene involved in organ size [Quercus suber]